MNSNEVKIIKRDLEQKLNKMTIEEQDCFLNKYGFKYERKTAGGAKNEIGTKNVKKTTSRKTLVVASTATEY